MSTVALLNCADARQHGLVELVSGGYLHVNYVYKLAIHTSDECRATVQA